MASILMHLLATLDRDERGEVSWKWLVIGFVIGAVVMLLLAVGGVIKFLIPGE